MKNTDRRTRQSTIKCLLQKVHIYLHYQYGDRKGNWKDKMLADVTSDQGRAGGVVKKKGLSHFVLFVSFVFLIKLVLLF